MDIYRIIHLIGQGAFYSESLSNMHDGSGHIVVYDCGSGRNKEIPQKFFEELDWRRTNEGEGQNMKPPIDILFISHFDADHVNGTKRLSERYDIKLIVLPLITPYKWYLYAVGANNDCLEAMISFRNILDTFKNRIIEVRPVGEDVNGDNLNNGAYDGNRILEGNSIINSGSMLGIQNEQVVRINPNNIDVTKSFWCYIPMNFEIEKEKINKLKEEIQRLFPDINLDDAKDISNHRKEIKQSFKNLKIKTNESSMLVYSGPTKDIRHGYSKHTVHRIDIEQDYYINSFYRHYESISHSDLRPGTACLYTGDAKIDGKRCVSIKETIGKLSENIGTLQIPHHGSDNNFNAYAFEKELSRPLEAVLCFASYGVHNSYHHPSTNILWELSHLNSPLIGVTEYEDSRLHQHIHFI